jgi:hypothetical protein
VVNGISARGPRIHGLLAKKTLPSSLDFVFAARPGAVISSVLLNFVIQALAHALKVA